MEPLYDRQEISRSYFFPQPGGALPSWEGAGPVKLALPDGTALGGFWCHGATGRPTLLYLHGNGECIAHQLHHWPDWARGCRANIFFCDYPGYATSDGQPSLTGCCQTALAALDHLLAQPADQVPWVVLMGRSVGSIFALHAAAARPDARVRGLALESGIADLKPRLAMRVPYELVGIPRAEIEAQLDRDFDHRAKIQSLNYPVLILHTHHDGLVPAENSELLARWAGPRLHRLVLFDRGDHNSIQWENETEYRQHLCHFLEALE
jgi:pimeloyl-ACP methyl ester carboxylesterase